MSIYEKIATTNQGSTYQVPNPLNTGEKEDTDWMSIVIIAQIVLLIVVAAAIYIFEVPILSSRSTAHIPQATEAVPTKAKNIPATKLVDQALLQSKATTQTEQEVTPTPTFDNNQDTKDKSTKLDVRSSSDDIAFELQKAWYNHDIKTIETILSATEATQFAEILQFTSTHLLQDRWLSLERFCKLANEVYRNDPQVALHCSDAYIAHGQQNKAHELFQARPPIAKNSIYYVRMAYLRLEMGDYKGSADIYRKLLDIDGSQPTWWLGLGYALTQQGDAKEAFNAYRQAYQYADSTAEYIGYLEDILSNGSYTS